MQEMQLDESYFFKGRSIKIIVGSRVRPKGFFLFRPKPKLTETAIFHFGRNRYRNRKYISVSAETDTETEINFHSFFSNFWSDLFQESRISYKNIFKSYKICFLRLFWYDFCRKYNFLEKSHSRNGWKNSENVFRLLTETEVLFRPIPKPKVVLQFRQNRNSAKMAEIRPKTETESVSVVP